MYNRRRLIVAVIIMNIIFGIIAGGLILQRFQTTSDEVVNPNPKFVIAEWDYPDEYGQGISQIQVEENSTGSWDPVELRHADESQVYEWNVSVFIRLKLWTWLNNSLVGAIDLDDGENYQRHNVTVTNFAGTTVFSQQNFTIFLSYDNLDPMWLYEEWVILNFLPEYGEVYTATVIYEIFW